MVRPAFPAVARMRVRDSDGMAAPMHEWQVAGALVESDGRLLLVRNQRRGGFEDWSTPGGVIDADDASLLEGLTREVEEETGLVVNRWEGPLYEVEAVAVDLGWRMRCEVHRAVEFEGEVRVDDPDGIVVEAAFVPLAEAVSVLGRVPPLGGRAAGGVAGRALGPRTAPRRFAYEVRGNPRAIVRLESVAVASGPLACRRLRVLTLTDPAPRPRRVLRVGRAARRPEPAGQAGRRRRARASGRGRGRELRGPAVRHPVGDADGPCPAGVPARGVPRAAVRAPTARRARR